MKDKLLTMTLAVFPITIILGTGLILLIVHFADFIDQSPETVLIVFGVSLTVFAVFRFVKIVKDASL